MSNQHQQQIYTDLIALCAVSDTFYFQDFMLEGITYRIFNYRLASYTDFLKPSALECRGIMFEVDSVGTFVRLVSRPMSKFFNLNENPSTIGLDLSKVDTVELKADGSLMSTYTHNGQLRLKSKGSLFSEQALDAMDWLVTRPAFMEALKDLDRRGWTVNLEWCAPHNRIVIGYAEPHLKVLNLRNRECGRYFARDMLELMFNTEDIIDNVDTNGLDVATFIQSVPSMQDDIEGYVARIGDLWFKVKTDKYVSLHHAKDSINNPRRLFEAIIDEGIDDLRSMFAWDVTAIAIIDQMQDKVVNMYNTIVATVEQYHSVNKHLERKDYAIGAQTLSFGSLRLLGLAMNKYLAKDPDYKGFLKSKYKELGFKDTSTMQE